MSDSALRRPGRSVFALSLLLTGGITLWALAFRPSFTAVSDAVFRFLTTHFDWLYMLAMVVFVVFAAVIACSRWGSIRLGDDGDRPEYSTLSWFAMLFGAGMGVGLVFWGISEPISHFVAPMSGIQPGSDEAADFAIRSCFMHWGFHPWANYSVLGLALAYFQYRRHRPALISTVLEPLLGTQDSLFKRAVDILAVFATVAGVVTSLGLGVLQINSGLHDLFGIPVALTVQIAVICLISVLYISSAVSGIDRGIRFVSNANLYIALTLMALAFLVGPRLEIIHTFVNGLGSYLGNFIRDSFLVHPYGDNSWIIRWRIFYWSWWIAWAPFVGVFIARISKGRTIREFLIGVVLAPSVGSFVWFAIFGTMGLNLAPEGLLTMEEMARIAAAPESGLFVVLQKYPMGRLLSLVSLLLLGTFFLTSANSSTYVLSMLTSGGALNPPNRKKVLWGAVQSVLAIGLLIAGGLKPLQILSITAAFPFITIMLSTCVSLVKALRQEPE